MNEPKLRLLAGIAGGLFGFAGILALAATIAAALTPSFGPVLSGVIVVATLFALTGVCAFIFLRPEKSASEEVDDMQATAAEALADLPFDVAQVLLQKRPLTAAALAAATGYSIMSSDDDTVGRTLTRVVTGLM